jgi:hypothetical protein
MHFWRFPSKSDFRYSPDSGSLYLSVKIISRTNLTTSFIDMSVYTEHCVNPGWIEFNQKLGFAYTNCTFGKIHVLSKINII